MGESLKSRYKPSFPKKYKGDPNNIICRSSWERKFCHWCDLNENVLEWGSEEFWIPYRSPVDNKVHMISSRDYTKSMFQNYKKKIFHKMFMNGFILVIIVFFVRVPVGATHV